MTDTPQHIQDLHLQIWLSKSLSERLCLALKYNEEIFLFGKEARKQMEKLHQQKQNEAIEKSS